MMTSPRSVGLTGLGHYVPQRRLTNQQLEATLDTTDAWIREKIGIRERPIAAEHQAASDLALPAAQQALEDAGVSPRDVDLIVVAVANQDTLLPPTAHWVQARLEARRAAAFDLRAACSGFLYGLVTGAQFVADGTYDTVLLIGVEHHSKMVDYTDRSTAVYFADGAGAAVLQAVPEGRGLLA
jgi:3-oxoacyl-[acyl-carrier-protein] synthase-3